MWPYLIAILALFVSVLATFLCILQSTKLSNKVEKSELRTLLEKSSEELSKEYGRGFKNLEMEWENTYQKMMKLAGRMDREKRTETPAEAESSPTSPLASASRSELLRRWRNKK